MTEPDILQDSQFGLSATLVSTALAGISMTLILLTFDATKRLNPELFTQKSLEDRTHA